MCIFSVVVVAEVGHHDDVDDDVDDVDDDVDDDEEGEGGRRKEEGRTSKRKI